MAGQVKSAFLIAPYAAWMLLMGFLPTTAWAYALRGGITAVLLAVFLFQARISRPTGRALWLGIVAGIVVFGIWISPETLLGLGSGETSAAASPYAPGVCGWPLTVVKLLASAFVIAVAEELFFRRWLVDFAGFWWTVALFAVEHGERWGVGAITGVIYGWLARRYGLWAAIAAHVTTNFVLGVWVITRGAWQYW